MFSVHPSHRSSVLFTFNLPIVSSLHFNCISGIPNSVMVALEEAGRIEASSLPLLLTYINYPPRQPLLINPLGRVPKKFNRIIFNPKRKRFLKVPLQMFTQYTQKETASRKRVIKDTRKDFIKFILRSVLRIIMFLFYPRRYKRASEVRHQIKKVSD